MKSLTVIFWTVTAAIGVTFAGSVYTAISQKKQAESAPRSIPMPATPGSASTAPTPNH